MSESDQMKSVYNTLTNWRDYFIINKQLTAIKDIESTPFGFIAVPQLKENLYRAMVACMQPVGNA